MAQQVKALASLQAQGPEFDLQKSHGEGENTLKQISSVVCAPTHPK